MNILIIPGFLGHAEEKTFEELDFQLTKKGHKVIKLSWPHFPEDMEKYSFTETIKHAEGILKDLSPNDTIILGFSMGGVIACHLAKYFRPKKVVLTVSPYQAGSEDDLEGKYKDWVEKGFRDVTSSRFGNLRVPFSFIEDARKYNAIEIIKDITCPILFIVGEKDVKVPNSVTRKLYDMANNPKEWYEVKGMEHKHQYQPEILPIVNEFILKFVSK